MKFAAKLVVRFVCIVLVIPAVTLYYGASLALGKNRAFPGWSQAFSLIPGFAGVYLRQAFYSMVLGRCGKDACVSFGVLISHPTAEIGRTAYVGPYCCLGDVTLEDDVLLSSQVSIMNGSGQHGIDRLDIPIREQPGEWPRITIGRDTWIGDRAVVMADVGKHCVIGAGSVVTTPIPDYAIAVGVPAKVVRWRKDNYDDRNERETNGMVKSDCASIVN